MAEPCGVRKPSCRIPSRSRGLLRFAATDSALLKVFSFQSTLRFCALQCGTGTAARAERWKYDCLLVRLRLSSVTDQHLLSLGGPQRQLDSESLAGHAWP